MEKNTYFYFLQKTIACKNFETLELGAWGNLAKKLFEKCVNTMGYRNALGSYGITVELGEHNHVIAILRYMTILKGEKQANKWEHTPKSQKPKGIVGSKGQWNIDYLGKVPNFSIKGSNSGLLG